MSNDGLYIGIMSGTSLDGVDVVLAEFQEDHPPSLILCKEYRLPKDIKDQLLDVIHRGEAKLDKIGELNVLVGHVLAEAVNEALEESHYSARDITAIGSHGITLWHKPGLEWGFSWQIGDPSVIAEKTGITTIGDFRSRDIAAGGQGAPLVPRFHADVFPHPEKDRVIVNIGGMSNITVLPSFSETPVIGYDTGPGNVLMDYWVSLHKNKSFDDDGQWAQSGTVNEQLLQHLLSLPFFEELPPKSTGRELFNPRWLQDQLVLFYENHPTETPKNIQTTLAAFTCHSIANEVFRSGLNDPEVIVCGGGAKNQYLMDQLQVLLPDSYVANSHYASIDPDWVEALAFAWMAYRTLNFKPSNLPAVTGALGERILGSIHPA